MADGGIRVTIDLDPAGLAARAERAGRAASLAAAEEILRRASALAPRRTGALAASGFVRAGGTGAVAGFASTYAPYQHEGLGFRHPGGGQARFLASAAEDPAALAALRDAFLREMGL